MASHQIATLGEVYYLPWAWVYPAYERLVDREKAKRRQAKQNRRHRRPLR